MAEQGSPETAHMQLPLLKVKQKGTDNFVCGIYQHGLVGDWQSQPLHCCSLCNWHPHYRTRCLFLTNLGGAVALLLPKAAFCIA
jgi:hypothetical protein